MPLVLGSNPVWFEVDLSSNSFDDTFYLFVLQNDLPYLPSVVYQDPNGNIPWTNPIQFLANGTLPINIYWDPNAIYRLEFRQGDDQSDPLIYLVENYQASGQGGSPTGEGSIVTDNQITNSQFSIINFDSPTTFTSIANPDPINVAPGWTLNLMGTGNVTLEQVSLNDSISTINPTNAPYALHITLTGSWTTAYLAQTFNQNGNLWSSGELSNYVTNSVTARIQGSAESISAVLVNSSSIVLTTVLSPIVITEEWNEYSDYGLMPEPSDSNVPPSAYLEYQLQLPTTVDIYLTSFQLISESLPLALAYNQDSIQRQMDHTFNYYKDPLINKPSPSYLIGWNFPLNTYPYGSSGSITTTPSYIANQTIAYTTSGSNVAWSLDAVTNGLDFTTADTNNAFYVLQYLTGSQVKAMLGNSLSVNVFGYQKTSGTPIVMNVYLFRGSSSATIPTLPTTIGTMAANGVFTLTASDWTLIPQNGFPTNQSTARLNVISTNSQINEVANNYGFTNFEIIDSTQLGDTNKFSVVVTFAYTAASTVAALNSVSVVPGILASPPAVSNPITSTRKIGQTSGNYTINSATYIDVDAVNLAYTINIPLGYNLHVIQCAVGQCTLGTSYGLGIYDSVANAIVGWGIITGTGSPGRIMNTATTIIQGDGAIHTIKMQVFVSSAAMTIFGNVGDTPTMDFLMVPSN